MLLKATWLVAAAVCLLQPAQCYYEFVNRIPNAERVPNPCRDDEIWEGVGHRNPAGAGTRNPFGEDFAKAGFRWTEWLCRRDSDGDGESNGEELGDPDCVWSEGATPARTTDISHPGVCPLNSNACVNDWKVCPKRFDCPAMRNPDVFVKNITLKETEAPAKETIYICQAFELNNNTAEGFHMIGSMPIIRNRHLMHHILVYGCSQKPDEKYFNEPQITFMGNVNCTEVINSWTYGIEGECFNEMAGVLVGGKGYRYVLMELHWNNPREVSGMKDSSGMSLYFTKKLRKYNQGAMVFGENVLVLPPRQRQISYNHTCPSQCTSHFLTETRHVTWAMIHMHAYGIRGRVSLWRGGNFVQDLVPMHPYDYNTPEVFNLDPPAELRKGDEVKTECYYTTKNSNVSVFWGFDTSQEMCFGILTYFPADLNQPQHQRLTACVANGGINLCKRQMPGLHVEQECNVTSLRMGEAARSAKEAMKQYGCFAPGCRPECRQFLNSTLWPNDACFDPGRAKRMAEVVASTSWLTSATQADEQERIMADTRMALFGQYECEQELRDLQRLDESPPVTQLPPSPPPRIVDRWHHGGGVALTVMIALLCCCCFALLLALLAVLLLALRLRAARREGGKTQHKLAFDNPATCNKE